LRIAGNRLAAAPEWLRGLTALTRLCSGATSYEYSA
jgi:hypothetical protein